MSVYGISSTGVPALVKGSPFRVQGQMEGVNGRYLIAVDATELRSYSLEPTGAVGKAVGLINTQNLSGAQCGKTSLNGIPNGAAMDRSGKYFYVQLFGASTQQYVGCSAWQSYSIDAGGQFTFLGDAEQYLDPDGYAQPNSPNPTISSDNRYLYAQSYGKNNPPVFEPFEILSSGALQVSSQFFEQDPEGNPNGGWYFLPTSLMQADNAGSLAVLMFAQDSDGERSSTLQLASYSIGPQNGSIFSANDWTNMPVLRVSNPTAMSVSPSGQILVIAGHPGLQMFDFDGKAPIASSSGVVLPAADIDQIAWDNSNHLFALSYAGRRLHIYSATPVSFSEVVGSPFVVPSAYGLKSMIVVAR